MSKQLSYVSMLSLQELTLRKIAVHLWSEPRTLASLGIFRFRQSLHYKHPKSWHKIVESEFSEKISKMQLPELLAKHIVRILKPVGLEIMQWKQFHENYLITINEHFDVSIVEKLHWTAAGTVDYRKTAEELLRCNVFDIVKSYKLACVYCFDHYIPELWEGLPQLNKMHFYNEEFLSDFHIRQPHYYWPYILKGEEIKLNRFTRDLMPFNQYAFQCSSLQGNKTAAKYFLQKLPPEEREASIVSTANYVLGSRSMYIITTCTFPNKNVSDVVLYLLSLMTPEQQIQIFREKPAEVLGCFMDWPWQDVFLDFADTLWTWMQCEDLECRLRNYDTLLRKLVYGIGKSNYCLPNLYQNFFSSSPSDFRRHFVEQESNFLTFFMRLIYIPDAESINVIISSLDAGDRLRLVTSKHVRTLFYIFVSKGEGHVVEKCLRGTGLSKEDKASLKEAFMGLGKRRDGGAFEWETPEWRRFFEFLDETDAKVAIKRSSDDESLTGAKKLCCEKEENPTSLSK